MESIEMLAGNIPEPEKDTNKESAEMLKALYEVGEKITGVIAKLSEMSDKLDTVKEETEETEETETKEETEETETKEESEE